MRPSSQTSSAIRPSPLPNILTQPPFRVSGGFIFRNPLPSSQTSSAIMPSPLPNILTQPPFRVSGGFIIRNPLPSKFIDVGKDDRALEALAGLIKNKPHKIWQKTPEKILFDYFNKFLELCVKLRKSDVAKEGLYHYRNICQQVNVNALEIVFRNFLKNAEERTLQASKETDQNVIDIEDLDIIQSPEELLLSTVSVEDSVDRNNRLKLMPWVKFLWESYRQCLDLLRNNNLVQRLYHDIANQTFQFCLKYSRRTEFKKLSENLRNHIVLLQKQNNPSIAIDLNNPETQQMHLTTRFHQLDTAIEMELWQEAFKAVQDIYGLMQLSKKPVKAPVRASYYQKLALVFWRAENNHLFHACALHRLYHLYCDTKKNFSTEESQKMCTKLLLATLSIPIPPSKNDFEKILDINDRSRKLAALLGLNTAPTRQSLINDIVRYNIVANVPKELKNLFDWMEVDFHPLKLTSRVAPCLEFIQTLDSDLHKYIPSLQEVTVFKLLQQVAQLYETIKFDRFTTLALFMTPHAIERLIVNSAKNNDIQVRIDHKQRVLSFGRDLSISCRDDALDSPQLQALPTEQIRGQIVLMAEALDEAVELLNPIDLQRKTESEQLLLIKRYQESAADDFQKINQRIKDIEKRKEMIENIHKEKTKKEVEAIEEKRRKLQEAEANRLKRELDDREKARQDSLRKEMELKNTRDKFVEVKSKVGINALKGISEADLENLNVEQLLQRHNNEITKQKQEFVIKLKAQFKKVDHLVRAIHQEEMETLQKYTGELMEARKSEWQTLEVQRIEREEKENKLGLQEKARLSRMAQDLNEAVQKLKEFHQPDYERALKDYEQTLVEQKNYRLEQRKLERKRQRKQKYEMKMEAKKKDREIREREEYEQMQRARKEEEHRMMAMEDEMHGSRRDNEMPPSDQDKMRTDKGDGGGWRRQADTEQPRVKPAETLGWRSQREPTQLPSKPDESAYQQRPPAKEGAPAPWRSKFTRQEEPSYPPEQQGSQKWAKGTYMRQGGAYQDQGGYEEPQQGAPIRAPEPEGRTPWRSTIRYEPRSGPRQFETSGGQTQQQYPLQGPATNQPPSSGGWRSKANVGPVPYQPGPTQRPSSYESGQAPNQMPSYTKRWEPAGPGANRAGAARINPPPPSRYNGGYGLPPPRSSQYDYDAHSRGGDMMERDAGDRVAAQSQQAAPMNYEFDNENSDEWTIVAKKKIRN